MSAPRAGPGQVALLFLRLGLTAFGGPVAHIALMEQEVVRRKGWLTGERFLDLLGVANLIPGPSSTELAIFIGYEVAGPVGLVLAGACFILPAALMVGGLAWAYVHFGAMPRVAGVLYGVKPVVIAVLVQALASLAPKAVKSAGLGALGVAACAASALGAAPIAVLAGAGAVWALAGLRARREGAGMLLAAPALAASASAPVSLGALFLLFAKVGALVFGSGYVLLAFLRANLVERLHWLTEAQLLDALAIGQVTPGPVFTTATFIGYVVAGAGGAVVATVGIFAPGFVLVAAARPLVARVRRSAFAGAFLDGVNVAALAVMGVAGAELARAALVDALTVACAAIAAALLLRFKVNAAWLVLAGALLGAVAGGR